MSPEQAKGRAADKRSDIWAFGAVLYEMLSGQRAFEGDDVPEVLAAVLRQEVDWNVLPSTVPIPVRRLIARCLEREVKLRLRDIGEARIALQRPFEASAPLAVIAPPRSVLKRALPLGLAAVAGGLLAAVVSWPVALTPPQVARLPYPLPAGQSFNRPSVGHSVALSPDGERIVYAANNRLYVRTLSEHDDRMIAGTETHQSASSPVFSPDGKSVAFFAAGDRTLRRIPLTGGTAKQLCTISAPYGMSWSEDGILVGQGDKGILRVSPDGGVPQVVVRVKEGEEAHGPQLLPDRQHVLFTLASGIAPDKWDRARIVVQALGSDAPQTLVEGGTDARFEPITSHILYVDTQNLLARPFDARRLTFTGSAVPVAGGVARSSGRLTGAAHFAVSSRSLIYVEGLFPTLTAQDHEVKLTSPDGTSRRLNIPAARYSTPRFSPDGTRLAIGVQDGSDARIAVYDLSGTSTLQLLTLKGNSRFPIWSRDGQRIVFQSDRDGDLALYQTTVGGGVAERLTRPAAGEAHEPEDWSPTEETLLVSVVKNREVSLCTASLPGGKIAPVGDVRSAFPVGARFSRDGRWVAYSVRGADRARIYVRPFPTGEALELLLSGNNIAAHKIGWSADGTALFYIPRIREFEMVRIITKPEFKFGEVSKVSRPFENPGGPTMRTQYDIAAKSGYFVGLFPVGQPSAPSLDQIEVVLNWIETVKARR